MKKVIVLLLILIVMPAGFCSAFSEIGHRLAGRILLQVEANGEAWYVNPDDYFRHFLGRPQDAFDVMREQGVGISNINLEKIEIGLDYLEGKDTDDDSLPDALEVAIGTSMDNKDTDGDAYSDKDEIALGFNPLGEGSLQIDKNFSIIQGGKIFLQVENNGEAWYVNPVDSKRYFLGRPADAFAIMRALGLGIVDNDLNKIDKASNSGIEEPEEESEIISDSSFELSEMEKAIHNLINNERRAYGLDNLSWDDRLAEVARGHSLALAKENEQITDIDLVCDYPMIHHEGTKSGFYVSDRLKSEEIYDYSKNGENIALIAGGIFMFLSGPGQANIVKAEDCRDKLSDWESRLKTDLELEDTESVKVSIILSEIQKRKERISSETLKIDSIKWKQTGEVMEDMVEGWMNSPGHRANILDLEFDRSGVGLAYVNGYIIGTQVFTKEVDCGFFEGPCCEKGGCYLPLACDAGSNICREE